jgi:putative Ca2+/H+ antiporter (TMEM165/GDT1 family)
MDWQLFNKAFWLVLLAELGDKTQLATLALASQPGSRWTVFAGAALALVSATAMAVFAGRLVSEWVPVVWLHRAAGLLFIVLGASLLLEGVRAPAGTHP